MTMSKAICIVAHFAYGAMTGGRNGHVGGVEWQTSLLAKWLAAHGHRVSLVTWDEGQADGTVIDGVRIIKMCGPREGLRGIRFFHPRWTSLHRAMERADADLYYQNCGEYITGQVALWCGRHGRKFVYSVASDPDCDPALPAMRTVRERVLYRYGLRKADSVIVQTLNQRRMLEAGFGLPSVVLPMPCPGPLDDAYRPPLPPRPRSCRVLWIGRISREKRLERLLDVAEALPDVEFHVVGNPNPKDDYSDGVLARARDLGNVTAHGLVEREKMPELYRRASMLLCTSSYEGFPNTFLEAWSSGLPVLSTVDPDGLIADRRLGFAVEDTPAMVESIRRLFDNPDLWREISGRARDFYLENHALEPAMSRFERLFVDLIDGNGNGQTGLMVS